MKTRFSEVQWIDRDKIIVRPKMFQNRNKEFSQASVDKILREGFDVSQEPIIVWYDAEIDKYLILSGHSRFEASRILFESGKQPNLAKMPVKEFLGNFEDAVYFANVESNRQGEAESLRGDLRALARAKAEGCISKECLTSIFKSGAKIKKLQDLTHLNIEGRFLEELDADNTGIYPNLELYARWTGDLRETYPQITDSHEDEIFKFLYAGEEGANRLLTKEDFYRMIENKVGNFAFVADEPLNLKNSLRKTVYDLNADEQIADIKKDIKALTERNNQLNGLMKKGLEQNAEGGNLPKNFDDWEQEHLRNNRSITKNILLMERISGNVKTLNVNDLDLFGSQVEPAKKETETLPISKTASQNINNLEAHELTYEEFLTRYKKYEGKDFSIGKTQVVYLEKKGKYKMSYATARGVQHYTGDFIEVLKQAYDNVIDRATKLGKLDKPEIVPVPEHTDESNKVEIVSDNKAQSFIKVIQTNIQACITGEGKILNKTQRGKIGESMGITAQKEVKELTELAIVLLAREQALRPDLSLRERYEAIVQLYECQPVISEQDSTSKSAQQYSTPVPIAFLAGKFTQQSHTQQVFEPSAGNAMLTIAYPPEKVYVNELDEERLASLQMQNFARVTDRNGAEPFPTGWHKQFDAVLTNPPFGTTDKVQAQKYELKGLEHIMAHYALECMQDKGRCAIIIGGHSRYDEQGRPTGGKERNFLYYLHTYYHVVDVINIDGGKLYSRQGTNFPVRLILIDGRQEEPELVLPTVNKEVVSDFATLYNRVFPYILYEQQQPNTILQPRLDTDRMAGADLGYSHSFTSADTDDRATIDVLEGHETDTRHTGGEGAEHQATRLAQSDRPDSVRQDDELRDSGGDTELGDGATPYRTAENSEEFGEGIHDYSDDTRGSGGLRRHEPRTDDTTDEGEFRLLHEISPNPPEIMEDKNKDNDEGLQPYKPYSKNPAGEATLIPATMATEVYRALATIKKTVGDIDTFVAKKLQYTQAELYKYLFNYQIDAVAMAIYNMEKGQAMIVGDQTGVGKGRTAAALIRYGRLLGVAPIFLTQTVDLFSDILRDLRDIGCDYTPFMLNANEKIVDKDGDGKVLFRSTNSKKRNAFLKKDNQNILKSGDLLGSRTDLVAEGYDFIIATYSQFNTEKYWDKIAFLGKQANANILILDESHNAGGEGTTSKVISGAIAVCKGCTYLSATFAKRPDNMPIYAQKTVIAEANLTSEEFVEAIQKGGAPLQEIVSAQLAGAGQMIRRERSFGGAEVNYVTLGITDENPALIRKHTHASDKITKIIQDIIYFQQEFVKEVVEKLDKEASLTGKEVTTRKGTDKAGVDNTPYFSRIFSLINQMLFSIKAKEVADLAIKLFQQGKSIVIAFDSTMEAMLDSLEVETGGVVENPDFAIVLQKGLDSVTSITKISSQGVRTKSVIPLSTLSIEGQYFYKKIQTDIREVATGISISPIDVLIDTLQRAGLRVGEMTGRKRVLNLNSQGKGIVENRRDKNKSELTRKFNAGDLDVLLLNRSASTGISLHASKNFKNQQRRAMIIAQPQLDINNEVQMRGRVHRVGQVIAPEYWYVSSAIPAEMRLMMMLKKKLKSLDANTTSNQKQSAKKVLDSEDFLNKYGDIVVMQYLIDNPDLNFGLLNDPLNMEGNGLGGNPPEGTALKVTGRVAILSSKEQDKFYKDIIDSYNSYVELLKQSGAYDLELEVMPLEAETKESYIKIYGNGGVSLFGADSVLERCEVNILRKPFKIAELKDKITDALEGGTANNLQARLLANHDEYVEERLVVIKSDTRKRADKILQGELTRLERIAERKLEQNEIEAQITHHDKIYTDALKEKQTKFQEEQKWLHDLFTLFSIGKAVNVPADLDGSSGAVKVSTGIFLGFDWGNDAKNPFARSRVKAKFAVNDGRRFLVVPLSQTAPLSAISSRSFMLGEVETALYLNQWEKVQGNKIRELRYIVTGNILQAFSKYKGKFVDYTLISGSNQKGIVMSEEWEDKDRDSKGNMVPFKAKVPIGKALSVIKGLSEGQSITTADGTVGIQRTKKGYTIVVPQSKQKGGEYYMDVDILNLTSGDFQKYANEMRANLPEDNIAYFVGILQTKFSQSVELETSQLADIPTTQLTQNVDNLIDLPENFEEADMFALPTPVADAPTTAPPPTEKGKPYWEVEIKRFELAKKYALEDKKTYWEAEIKRFKIAQKYA